MFGFLKRLLPKRLRKKKTVIPVVRLHGAITAESGFLQSGLSLSGVAAALEDAFDRKDCPAVALMINSPGGSPVQSRMIFQRIRSLAKEHDKQVLVFVEDVAASGGYMLALAGDEIFVDPTSIVGSIGVVSGGFGFTGVMEKAGVERRLYTAGSNKAILDPFSPEKAEDVAHLLSMQKDIHQVFIDMVKERRGARLKDDPDLFSGLFWSGQRGLELGLVDAIGSLREVLRERFGEKTEMELVESPRSMFGRRLPAVRGTLPGADAIAASLAKGIVQSVEERALWSRYGL